jgi:SSS family solute:Na+ symporter
MFINWLIGVILVYSILFGTGKWILSDYAGLVINLAVASVSFSIVYNNLSKIGWKTLVK